MTPTRTASDIRTALLDLLSDLQRERDVMPHTKLRLGQAAPVDPATMRYRAASRALDHLQEAVNNLSSVIAQDGEDWQ